MATDSPQKITIFGNENKSFNNAFRPKVEEFVLPINPSSLFNWARVLRVVLTSFLVMILLHLFIICFSNYTTRGQIRTCYGKNCRGANVFVYDGKQQLKSWPNPPQHKEVAKVARYVMHISEWGSLATTSTHKNIDGYPFTNIFSVSDGPYDNSTGVPYFYFTPMELSVRDLEVDNKTSLTVSLAQSDFCAKNRMDPEDPRCAHIILSGNIAKLQKDSVEETFAKKSLFSRHWEMTTWPTGHSWFFAKLDIKHIYVLDYFGGAISVDVNEYFNSSFVYPNQNRFGIF